jgi:hypothetical protein
MKIIEPYQVDDVVDKEWKTPEELFKILKKKETDVSLNQVKTRLRILNDKWKCVDKKREKGKIYYRKKVIE